MTFSGALFSFKGRLGRLAFFGYLCLEFLVLGLLIGVGIMAITNGGGGAIAGGAMCLAAGVGYVWITIALYTKRLHDLNMSGLHFIWIIGVSLLAGMLTQTNGTLSAILYVVSFCVGLWLLFAPGTLGPNRFGNRPGTIAPPDMAMPTVA